MRHVMGWVVVLSLAGGCAATKAERQEPAVPASSSEQAIEVVSLQFASAEFVAEDLRKLGPEAAKAGGAEPKVMVDPRTNSLILQGSPGWIARLKQRIGELDQQRASPH